MTDWDAILGEDKDEAPVPEATYPMRVQDSEGVIASSGAEMIKLTMAIEGGPHDDRWIWTNLVYPTADSKPGHRRMFWRKLRAFDITQEWVATHRPSKEQLAELLKGRSVRGDVIIRKWETEDRNDISMFHSLTAASGMPEAPVVATAPAADEPPPTPDLSEVAESPKPEPPPTTAPAPKTGDEPPPPF
jgi:hypothetical protein